MIKQTDDWLTNSIEGYIQEYIQYHTQYYIYVCHKYTDFMFGATDTLQKIQLENHNGKNVALYKCNSLTDEQNYIHYVHNFATYLTELFVY